jgi:hypothetical protein
MHRQWWICQSKQPEPSILFALVFLSFMSMWIQSWASLPVLK